MTPSIEIDEDVFAALQERAEPFVDTPNSVLRHLLELSAHASGADLDEGSDTPGGSPRNGAASSEAVPKRARSKASKRQVSRTRAASGSLLHASEYEIPILQVLEDHGGRAASREVVAGVGKIVGPKLKPNDKEKLTSGEIRWENRVHFTRLRLIDSGLLKKDSPRGVWEITPAGSALLRES